MTPPGGFGGLPDVGASLVNLVLLGGVIGWIFFLGWLLFGCGPTPIPGAHTPTGWEAEVVQVAAGLWPHQTERCDTELGLLQVASVDDSTMRDLVGYCAAGGPRCQQRPYTGCLLGFCATGSQVVDPADPPWPDGRWRVTILLSAYSDPRTARHAMAHEMGHVLARCTYGFADEYHTDPEIWDRPDGLVYRTILEVDQ